MLTDAKLRKLKGKPCDKRYELSDAAGLSVRITPAGMIVFQFRYQFNGKPRRMSLGQYDEVSLKEAREAVVEAKKILGTGKDPITVREMKLDKQRSSPTVEACIKAWLESAPAKRLVKHDHWERALNRHVVSQVGSMVVEDMEVKHWEPVFARMRANGAETFAGEMLSRMKTVFSYCIRTGLIRFNPVAELRVMDVGKPVKTGKRVFNDKEIGAFWLAVSNTGRYYAVKKTAICLFLLMSLVGCSNTRTVYVPAQCTPIPPSLTQPMVPPLPPAG